ncbi:MAG: 4-(cytidine 5'-diphospho)-2-C-methyl-D-erythritol kinase [Treponema sp.]|jgi:4-diphosphocytidyl-2-C-methyl-D-erythritol kinase|nr:4-(cytidine 5'-diphospho)-2-C-methyl-D-erythritol kinase [Treponema sp.]
MVIDLGAKMDKIPAMRPGITLNAPCKINLHLRILNRRGDGFHPIESVFVPLDFGDTLSVSLSSIGTNRVHLENRSFGEDVIPQETNLVYRAAELFCEKTAFKGRFETELVKRVPAGAGLGGGSSDAAAALKAFNTLAGNPLDRDALALLALELGSDVPFFLYGQSAWVTGRGEIIEPLPYRGDMGVVLVFPGFSSDTAGAYRLLDARSDGAGTPGNREAILDGFKDLSSGKKAFPFQNDFLPLFLQDKTRGPVYAGILDVLEKSDCLFAGLSGSGSACFGLYADPDKALQAEKRLWRIRNGCRVKSTFFLACETKGMYNL